MRSQSGSQHERPSVENPDRFSRPITDSVAGIAIPLPLHQAIASAASLAVPYCSALTNHAQRPLLAFGIYNVMEPLCRSALQNKKAGAWVAFNDMEALSILFFLKQNSVKIPQEISVIGIDSSLESLRANLTSYNFTIPAVIHCACQHILDPNYSVRKSNESLIVELDGIVVARGTG